MKYPYRRKTYNKRKSRKFNISRTLRSYRRNNVVSIKRSFLLQSTYSVYPTWTAVGYTFSLADLASSYTEFTNVFEQYRINAAKLTFLPYGDGVDYNQMFVNAGAGAGSVNTITQPRVYTALDFDGNPRLGTENEILQYGNHKIVRDPLKGFSIFVKKPRVQFGTANALTIVGGAPKKSPWLDVDNFNVKHHGCVVGGMLPYAQGLDARVDYSVVLTLYLQFKNAI